MIRSAGACLVFALASSIALAAATGEIPSPDEFLGHEVGADRYLAPYDQVLAYMRALAEASPRVAVEVAGRSTLGREMVIVVLTSETNQRSLPRYREIARRLAHPEGLGEETARALIDEGKTIALITCTIHSTEVGSTQMAMEFAHKVATTRDPRMLRWLDDVILLLMPSINPDGQAMVIDWYNKHLGTQYEGGRMPWLYHHYVGHDDNRDFYMLTQKETQVVNDVLYHRWFPQVFLDEHQMGSTGPRMFVPPQTDPVAPEIDSMILRFADLLGTGMGLRLEEAGKQGVGRDMIYDSYWPGGTRNTAWWKNIVGLLTEVASARIATPIYIEPGELKGGRKGFPDYVRRANYLTPWTGGWWRLRDIIDYELIATQALLEGCSRYREDLLANVHRLAQQEIRRGRTEPPYAFVIPPGQHDPVAAALMVDLLLRHGIRVERSDALLALGDPNSTRSIVPSGSYVVRTSQPYRPFVLTMLQPQRYPEVLDAVGGKVIPPYDVTSWSLPVAMGVDVMRVDEPLDPSAHLHAITSPAWPGGAVEPSRQGYLAAHSADSSFIAANRLLGLGKQVYWLEQPPADAAIGDLYIPADQVTAGELETLSSELHLPIRPLARRPAGRAFRLHPVRVGLYKPWLASIDEGWTRWLLERYEFPLVSLTNKQLRSGSFKRDIDVLLLPDVTKQVIIDGRPEKPRERFTPLPPEYAGGIGPEGGEQIAGWIRDGGAAVALDSSAEYLVDLLSLPVSNVLQQVGPDAFSCPGSMLRLEVENTHPVAYGMRRAEAGYFASSPAFETMLPDARFDRRVVASYPAYADRILVSGYLKGASLLVKRAAVVDLRVGKGRVVLIGLRAQHRAQPHRTFKLLFNALFLPELEETTLP